MKSHSRVTGIIILIIGLVLIFWPLSTLETLCKLIGWCAVIAGVLEIVLGAVSTPRCAWNISGGVVAILVGLCFLLFPNFIITFLPRAVGIATALGGAAFLGGTIRTKEKGVTAILTIIGSVVAILAGLVLVFYAAATVRLLMVVMGVFLAYFGVMRILGKRED